MDDLGSPLDAEVDQLALLRLLLLHVLMQRDEPGIGGLLLQVFKVDLVDDVLVERIGLFDVLGHFHDVVNELARLVGLSFLERVSVHLQVAPFLHLLHQFLSLLFSEYGHGFELDFSPFVTVLVP